MFKLVVLSVLIAVAAARPSHFESAVVYSAPTVAVKEAGYAHVGHVVKSVPSAISHHSNSVVHSTAHTVQDIVAPAVKTTAYTTKTLAATPIVESYAVEQPSAAILNTVAASPVVQTYAAASPLVHTYNAVAPVLHSSYVAPAATYAAASPLSYTATGVW